MFFNVPYTCDESAVNVRKLVEDPASLNDISFLKNCKAWFEECYPGYTAFMTTSCTRAMELLALSLNLREGDEIILSPFTYVGVGNAFSNYGVRLVYTDIDPQTMNINADKIEDAITNKTKAIIAMHYASIPCEMEKIMDICERHDLVLIEDNAQGIQTTYNNQLLGSFGDFSCISFDMLKNVSCNEGGVLLCKNDWMDKVDVAYYNGTNKTAFSKGLVNRYEWVDRGSKFSMSEYTAAVLYPLLTKSAEINAERKEIWNSLFKKISNEAILKKYIPQVMLNTEHNAHLAYLKLDNPSQRTEVLKFLNSHGVPCSFHYIPLDNSVEGKRCSNYQEVCPFSQEESECLLRLPMHNFLSASDQDKIVSVLCEAIKSYSVTASISV